jgi:non-heme chloroperoxidase
MAYVLLPDETPLFYIDEGAGRPIVLLQGLMHTASYHWQKNIPALSETNRVLAIDHRSHGLSGKPRVGHSIKQCAADLHHVLTTLDLTDVVLGGLAFGAMIMLQYIRDFDPERLAKLAIIEAQVRLTNAPDWEHPTFGNFPAEAGVGFVEACKASRAPLKGFISGGFSAPLDEDTFLDMYAQTCLTPTDAVISYVEDMCAADYRPDVARLPLPTVFLYGRKNNNTLPTELGRWMHDTAPNSDLVLFQNSAHNPYWEEADRFNAVLAGFAAT